MIKTTFLTATATVTSVALALTLAATGCSSTASTKKELGVVTVGAYTLDIAEEGSAVAPGVQTRFVIKATAGGKPTSITGWIGIESGQGSSKKLATYDGADGDFDDDVVAPTPIPAGSKFWFEVYTNDKKDVGSIAYLP